MRKWVVLAGLACVSDTVSAQGDCFPAPTSNEARTLARLAVPLTFSGAGKLSQGWSIGLEVADLPEIPRDMATPTTCRPGKGPERTDPVPALVRPRLGWARSGVMLEGFWLPPLRLAGVRGGVAGASVGISRDLTPTWAIIARAHAVVGGIRAAITCPDEAIADPTSECGGGTRSDDRWEPGTRGVEATLARNSGAWRPHAGVGTTWVRARFRVNFTNAQGEVDRRRVSVDLRRTALYAGISRHWSRVAIVAEAYGTTEDAVIGRVVVRTR